MCGGTYDCGEKVVHTKLDDLTEISYDQLYKDVALLSLACVMLRKSKLPEVAEHNLFFKEFAGVFNQYKLPIALSLLTHASAGTKRSESDS